MTWLRTPRAPVLSILSTAGKTGSAAPSNGAPLVTWLDCGSYAATYAYINKEIVTAYTGGLQSDGITISGEGAGVSNPSTSTWLLDDVHHDYLTGGGGGRQPYQDYFTAFDAVLSADDLPGTIVFNQDNLALQYPGTQPAITSATDPTAYGSWGVHSGVLRGGGYGDADAWPCSGDEGPAQVTFTFTNANHIGWWIGMSVESYNGEYGDYMGDPTEILCLDSLWQHDSGANN